MESTAKRQQIWKNDNKICQLLLVSERGEVFLHMRSVLLPGNALRRIVPIWQKGKTIWVQMVLNKKWKEVNLKMKVKLKVWFGTDLCLERDSMLEGLLIVQRNAWVVAVVRHKVVLLLAAERHQCASKHRTGTLRKLMSAAHTRGHHLGWKTPMKHSANGNPAEFDWSKLQETVFGATSLSVHSKQSPHGNTQKYGSVGWMGCSLITCCTSVAWTPRRPQAATAAAHVWKDRKEGVANERINLIYTPPCTPRPISRPKCLSGL